MRNSRIALLIISIFIYAISANANETKTTEAIPVTDGASRHYLTLETAINEIVLQDLKRGETYKIFLSNHSSDCLPFFIDPISTLDLVLEFEAQSEEQSILLGKSCDAATDIRFSIACTSCDPRNSSRSMTGIEVDEFYTAGELVEDVFISGNCFDVETGSISYTGNNLASGYFSNGGTSINLEDGIILSTGNAQSCVGPNEQYNTGNSFLDFGTDPDLSQMVNTAIMYDIAALEFDFTPTTDQISFEFVFASEEYCEYVNSSFNDVFGFFISGPGINGPFSNNAENIALVPNSNNYTAINSVNHLSNPTYYVNNIPSDQHSSIPSYLQCENYPISQNGIAINDIEYDGFTSVMTAMANVEPCETYHIKLIIADVADGYYDSAVFLKANSFSSGENAEVYTEAQGGGAASNVSYESCDDAYFVFERVSEDLSQPLEISYVLSPFSTATAGLDYEALPSSITIPAGDSVYYLPLTVYDDAILEGTETIILELDAPCSCAIPNISMFIEDIEPLAVVTDDVFFCDPVPLIIEPTITGGWGSYTFLWNTGDTTAMLDFYADADTLLSIVVIDECGNSIESFVDIEIVESPTATISGTELVCMENPDAELQIAFTGDGPWELIYTIDNVAQPAINVSENPFVLETSVLGTFQLQSVNNMGCIGTVAGLATVAPVELSIDFTTSDESCPGAEDGSISITPSGGSAPYDFAWSNGIGNVEDPENLLAGTYDLVLTDANGCSIAAQYVVDLDPNVPVSNAGLDESLDCIISMVSLNGTGSQGSSFSYEWTTMDGNIVSGENTMTPIVDQAGTYNFNVTNTSTNCVVSDKVEVFIDTITPTAAISIIGPLVLDCSEPSTVIDGSGSVPNGSLSFEWTTADGNISDGSNTIAAEVNAGGNYQLQVTNTENGCINIASVFIGSNMDLPQAIIDPAATLTCVDSVITIDAQSSSSGVNYTILWTTNDGNIITGENTLFPTVDQPGTYSMTILNTSNDCENTSSVTVMEDRIAPIADAGLPTEMDCNDDFVNLNGSQSSTGSIFSYQWTTSNGLIQNGENSLAPEVNTAGDYILLVSNTLNGCTAIDATEVFEDPDVPNAAAIEIFAPQCFGDEASLGIASVSGGEAPYVYSIDGGQNFYGTNIFRELQPGSFNVVIQDSEGCMYEEAVFIPGVSELLVDVEPLVEIDLGDTYQIDAIVNVPFAQLDSVLWSPNETLTCGDCLDPIAFPLQTTNYQITVIDQNGCEAMTDILLRVDKDRKVFIPNAFSPNADGANDHFMIYAKEGLVTNISRFKIYDRWGGQVFGIEDGMPNDPGFGWDGTFKGSTVNPSVFIYFAEIEFIDGAKVIYKGDITVTD